MSRKRARERKSWGREEATWRWGKTKEVAKTVQQGRETHEK